MGLNMKEKTNTTISTQVITASLTMITVIGAFVVFIIDKRQVGTWYYLIAGLAFLCFVISIFLGGKGLSGKGKDKKPNPYFNWQAIMAVVGVVLFCISVFLGKEKPDTIDKKFIEQDRNIIDLKVRDTVKMKEIQQLNKDIDDLKKRVDKLEKTDLNNRLNNK
jgi:hypothetical protein